VRSAPLAALLALAISACVVGCPPTRGGGDDDDACDPSSDTGQVRACVYWSEDDPSPQEGGKLYARQGETEPIEAFLDADGCVTMEMADGTWELSVANAYGDCQTYYEPFEIVACETLELDFYVLMWCMDG
jgi:hypothetical protein